MSACKKWMMEATKELCQRDGKGDKKICFILDSRFVSKILEEAAMDVGEYMVSMVKTNKNFCKETINKLKNIGREVLSSRTIEPLRCLGTGL